MSLLIHCKDTTVFLISNSFDKKNLSACALKRFPRTSHPNQGMTCVENAKIRTRNYFSRNSMAKPPPRAMNTGTTLSDVTSCSVIT